MFTENSDRNFPTLNKPFYVYPQIANTPSISTMNIFTAVSTPIFLGTRYTTILTFRLILKMIKEKSTI